MREMCECYFFFFIIVVIFKIYENISKSSDFNFKIDFVDRSDKKKILGNNLLIESLPDQNNEKRIYMNKFSYSFLSSVDYG